MRKWYVSSPFSSPSKGLRPEGHGHEWVNLIHVRQVRYLCIQTHPTDVYTTTVLVLFPFSTNPRTGKGLVTFDGFLGSNRWPGQRNYHMPVCTLLCNRMQILRLHSDWLLQLAWPSVQTPVAIFKQTSRVSSYPTRLYSSLVLTVHLWKRGDAPYMGSKWGVGQYSKYHCCI